MAKVNLVKKIEEVAVPICEANSLCLYDIAFEAGGKVLKVFIDREDSKGIQIEDCEKVSRALSEFLDENEEMIPAADYALEVSSPGVERKLSKLWHFEKALESKIEIKLFETLGKLYPETSKKLQRAKTLQGVLVEAGENDFAINIDGDKFRFSYDKLAKANIVFDF